MFSANFCNLTTMEGKTELINALEMLGEFLEHKGLHFELAIVGGAALLLRELISRSTLDMDVVAIIHGADFKAVNAAPILRPLGFRVGDTADE
jgi:hypothetical protein